MENPQAQSETCIDHNRPCLFMELKDFKPLCFMCTKGLNKSDFVEIQDYCENKAEEFKKTIALNNNPIIKAIVADFSENVEPQDQIDLELK